MERVAYRNLEARQVKTYKPPVERFDRFLRRNDTFLAKAIRIVSRGKRGEEYLKSPLKRALDLAASAPIAIVATPAILALGIAKKLEDGGSMFFIQKRTVGRRGREIKVVKIRSMREGAHDEADFVTNTYGRKGWEDPRSTSLGALMRKYDLDEFPQFLQVLTGELSLVGIRPSSDKGIDLLTQKWSRERFEDWQLKCQDVPIGISGTAQLFGSQKKEGEKRYHFDLFYANNASLGLDVYLIVRTAARMLRILP